MRRSLACLLALLLAACGSAATRAPIGTTLDLPSPAPSAPAAAPAAPVPGDIVARSAAPFRARRNSDQRSLEQAAFYDELSHFDVICLGEAHDAARDHFAELAITEALELRARVSGRALGLGFEMFQAPYADALYSYGRGRIDDAKLRKRTHYDERWGYPYAYYRPLLALGRRYGLPLKALNAASELSQAVARVGLDNLSPRLRRELPQTLDLDDATHRARFDRLMSGHPHPPGMNFDNLYAAQVVWDETMAENATNWVRARAPSRQLVIFAGSAHCAREAIPARVERREALRVVSVRLSATDADDGTAFDYSLLFADTPS